MRAIAIGLFVLGLVVPASARAGGDLSTAVDLALENFDLGDYDAAEAQLETALGAGHNGADAATVARAHLVLGAVYLEQGNDAGARASFARALAVDETARPESRYADEPAMALFESVRAEREAATSCDGIAALSHTRGQPAKSGKPYSLQCLAGNQLGDVTLYALYRTDPEAGYAEAEMTKSGECTWTAEIPAVDGEQLEYHFAAKNESGTVVAAHGSAASPIAVMIEASAAEPAKGERAEDEVPQELGGKPPKPRAKGCAGCSGAGASGSTLVVLLSCALLARRRRNTL